MIVYLGLEHVEFGRVGFELPGFLLVHLLVVGDLLCLRDARLPLHHLPEVLDGLFLGVDDQLLRKSY